MFHWNISPKNLWVYILSSVLNWCKIVQGSNCELKRLQFQVSLECAQEEWFRQVICISWMSDLCCNLELFGELELIECYYPMPNISRFNKSVIEAKLGGWLKTIHRESNQTNPKNVYCYDWYDTNNLWRPAERSIENILMIIATAYNIFRDTTYNCTSVISYTSAV